MDKNDKLKNIAIKILSKSSLPKEQNHGFALVTMLMIISVVLTCIRILQECNKKKLGENYSLTDKCNLYGEQIKEFSNRRGWFTKMRIKKILRKELSPEDYNKYSFSILNALLDTGEVLTDDEIKTLVEAANV